MDKKLQTSLEFIIMIGFVLLFFSVFLLIIQENMLIKLEQEQSRVVDELVSEVQYEINLALEASDGYSREFLIPEKIVNKDYNIMLTEGLVYLNTTDGKYAVAVPIPEVNGTIQKGANTIRKQDSEILLNQ